MAEIVVGTKIGETVLSRVTDEAIDSVWRQIGYVWNYKTNIQDLNKQLTRLKDERNSMQHRVDEATRNGKLIENTVTNWFKDADEAIGVAEQIIEDNGSANKSCFMGCCPNLKTRHQFSRKAKKQAPVIAQVQGDGKSITDISFFPYVQQLQHVGDKEALASRTQVMNEIVGALKDVDFNLIGVYGMAGVGKTTLVTKHLIAEVKRAGVFEVVTWTKVTHNPDLKTIQEEIAAWLGLKFEVDSTQVRAVRLHARLKQEEKVLVILDDIWTKIQLEEIGIPNDKDNRGCKIVMTSRDQNVLQEMGVQKDFRLQVLQPEEAWQLFQQKLDKVVDSDMLPIAKEVAERCAGLPVLITAVAGALRSQQLNEWKDTLQQLKQFAHEKIEDQVNSALNLSYNFLKVECKLVFLLCAQNGPLNIDIAYLLKYAIGLGMLKHCKEVEAARIRLHSLVNNLKASSWLLESNKDGELQMHHLVYNFAITVASRDQPVITGIGMEEWPEDDKLENYMAIVLNNGKVPRLSKVLNCPKLRFLLLNNEDSSLEIGDDFFGGVKGLEVLNLKIACFSSSLPLSLQCLKDLQTLCLDSCVLNDIAIIGKLQKLKVLSLVNCTIPCFPREIGNSTHLQLLDLKNCSSLEVIEPNVLSSLTQLEELYLENSFIKWESIEGNNGQRKNANLTELKHLSKLVTLHIHILDATMLPYDLPVKQLERFRILIGAELDWSVEHKTTRSLKLKLNTINHLEGVRSLLMKTEDLYLHDLVGVENVLNSLNKEGFPQLKHLFIQNSPDIRHIIDCRRIGRVTAFPCLESLSLNNLHILGKICNAPSKMMPFSYLRRIKVGNCSILKYLFSFSMFRGLHQLEEIDVNNCEIMKMIVGNGDDDDDDDGVDEAIKLQKLHTLTLDHLPDFASFCSQVELPSSASQKLTMDGAGCSEIIAEDEIETPMVLFTEKIEFPNLINLNLSSTNVKSIWSNQLKVVFQNLTSLIVDGCWNLSYLFTSSMVQNLAELKKLEISNCSSMREIISGKGLEEEIVRRKILFPKLDILKLKHLPKLERFCSGNLLECTLLKVLRVESCHYLQAFVCSSVQTDMGVNGGARQHGDATLFDDKVSFPNLEELEIFHMHRLRMIWKNEDELAAGWFEKLKVLKVEHAKQLLQLFPSNMLIGGLRNLETVVVKYCDLLEQVFDLEGVMVVRERLVLGLRTLEMQNLSNMKRVWNIGDTYNGMETLSWNNLRSVNVQRCQSLKSLFPASIAIDLLQLEKINLSNCWILEELVVKGLEISPSFYFPNLKFLQLHCLYELRSFYPGAHMLECTKLETLWVSNCHKLKIFALESPNLQEMHVKSPKTEAQPLFDFTQVVRSLKKMTLSYEVAMMVKEAHLPSYLFNNLEELNLECFDDGSSYLPFELLHRFQNIQTLHASRSDFEEIFPHGDDQNVGILAQIRYLNLNYLPKLRRIWNQGSRHKQVLQNLHTLLVTGSNRLTSLEPSFESFQNLQTLDVYRCDGLMYLFKSTAAKSLVHLKTISVKECNMVTEIVAVEGDETQSETDITLSKLESLKLDCLESIVCISLATCPMKFTSLTEVTVMQCPKMKFFSRGNLYAPKLKKIYVTEESDKGRWVGDLNSTIKQLYIEMAGFDGVQQLKLSEFPELKEIWLVQLPVNFFFNLTSLVVDDCPFQSFAIPSNLLPFLIALEKLEIRNCDLLEELFDLERPNTDRSFGYLSNLKEFQLIGLPQLRHVWDEIPKDLLDVKNLTSLKIENCNSLRNVLTSTLCLSLVQLKTLEVTSCQMVKEIITATPTAEDGVVGHVIVFPLLECITLEDLPNLTSLYSGTDSVECPYLKEITIADCPQLNINNTIAESKIEFPSLINLNLSSTNVKSIWSNQLKVAFQNLTSLIVDGCWKLSSLFTSSMVQNLAELKKLEISNCSSMREIISREGLEEEIVRRKILFPKLDILKLKHLPKLERFCSGNLLECTLLKVLRVESCHYLQAFVCSSVQTDMGVNGGVRQHGDATLFDDKVSFPNLEELEIFHMHRLRMIWKNEDELPAGWFEKLKVLKVEHAKQLLQLLPSNMLIGGLRNLETLVVNYCDLLEQVFDLEGVMVVRERLVLGLRTLDMQNLSNMKRVWNIGDTYNGMETLSWNNLRSVNVQRCQSLKSLFPASIATDLLQLEELDVANCEILEELVVEGLETSPTFVFPKLNFLQLHCLYELRSFYPGAHTLECTKLETLWVSNCHKLKIFALESPNLQEMHVKSPKTEAQPLFDFTQVVRSLKKMTLSYEVAMMVKEAHLPSYLFINLEVLDLRCFHDGSSYLPFELLHRFQNIRTLYAASSDFEEIFPHGDDQNVGILAQIRYLKLNYLRKLRRIWNQGSRHKQVLQNLHTLEVTGCHRLTSLEPSFESFQNLQTLDVYNNDGLMYLFKSTAAKSLVHLKTISVKECNMVTEIVAVEGDETQSETDITLSKLESLKLYCLESIVCFTLANCPMKFPSLTEVIVTQCPKMKFFSRGNLYVPKMNKVYVSRESDKWRWVGDLNSTMKQLYVEMAGFDGIQQLKLSEFPELKQKWLAQLPINFFYNLTSLVVDDCPFQSFAIPSNLLPFLIALEKLEIRNCDLLEELFDLERPNTDRSFGYLSNLKEFQLIGLPQLRHVWDEIPKDLLDVKNLTSLKIENCNSLRNVLTPTLCLSLVQLKTLQVTSCQMVKEIITAAPTTEDGAMGHVIVFPLLECITLEDLPNLTSLYSGTDSVECPYLKDITIARCPQLNINNTIVESKVVSFPHPKNLKPSSIDIEKIWNGRSLTSLTIDGFRNLKFLFPPSIAKSLLHLKKVEISNCEMLEQVIAMEAHEEQMMRLPKIDFLKLKDLPQLTQFSICKMLECPSLKELQVQNCPQLMVFVSDYIGPNVVSNSEHQITTSALFDDKVAFPNLEKMQVVQMDNLRMIWCNKLYLDSFGKLEVLKVEYAQQLLKVFPHDILARLQNLKDLVIKNCDSLEEVFDIPELINEKGTERAVSQLRNMDIRNMPNLRWVWNEDSEGVVSFGELSSMYVWNCPNLKSLFPFSIAKSLEQLQELDLNACGLEEMVTKEKGAVEKAPKFVFPRLKYLDLWYLEKLDHFFKGIHTLDCPVLERLSVYSCDKLDVFTQIPENPSEIGMRNSLLSFSKIIPNMRHLSLTSTDAQMIKESQFPPELFDKLASVELCCFHDESEDSPSDLLKLFHNLEKLYVRSSMFKELFPCEGPDQALQTLEILKVVSCDNLITLAPSSASFQNLMNLGMDNCDGLVILMAQSTAKSLVQLTKISIKNCEKVSEIVSSEGSKESKEEEEIVFPKLENLKLSHLPSLVCFSSVECSFEFPSLFKVRVSQCPNIKFFSKRVSTTPILWDLQLSEVDKQLWNKNRKTTVQPPINDDKDQMVKLE